MKHAKLVRPKGSKNRIQRARGGPLTDLLLACLKNKQLRHGQLFELMCKKCGRTLSLGAFCGAMFRLRAGPYKRIYVVRWERHEGPGRHTLHRIFAVGSHADAPKPSPLTQVEKQRERRKRRRAELAKRALEVRANSSIFALADAMQRSQNRQIDEGIRR